MGLFNKKSRMDWAHDPVTLDETAARHLQPTPDTVTLIDQAIASSGVDPRQVDRVDLLVKVWNVIKVTGADWLTQVGRTDAAAALAIVAERPDFDEDMLWNFFSHWGPQGVAVQHRVVEIFTSGQMAEVLVQLIRDGSADHDIKGNNRV